MKAGICTGGIIITIVWGVMAFWGWVFADD
jgi:hypothetical protein